MFKTIEVCVCDICKQPIPQNLIRVLLSEMTQSEISVPNSRYDARPIDVCPTCMSHIESFISQNLSPDAIQVYDQYDSTRTF